MSDVIARWAVLAAIVLFLLWTVTEALASEAIPPEPVVHPAVYQHPEPTP